MNRSISIASASLFALYASLPAVALAEPTPAPPAGDEAGTVVVTANRTPQPIERVGSSVSVVTAAELERRQTQIVSDVLRTLPGVTVARNGGIGGTTSVFIRGAESEQTVALIDGVKLNDPSSPGGGFNFGNLLVGNIERIELLRGPSSVLWGSQAIGGVVNLITRQPTEQLVANGRVEYGYRHSVQAVANVSDKIGPLALSGGGGYFRTDGISAFSEARGGTEKDGYTNYGANLNLSLALTDAVSLEARGYYSDGEAGIDGFAPPTFGLGDTREITRTRDFVGYGGARVALFGGRLRNRLGYAYTDVRRRNLDLGAGGAETFAGNGRNERFEYQGVWDIAKGWQATFGVERETSRFATSSFGGPVTRGRARLDSIYGQLVATPVDGLTLTGGVRRDEHDRFGGWTTLGASGVWVLGSGTTLRASYAEGFKAPSLFQLQSNFGNQQLRPERSQGWDAGITQSFLGGAAQAGITWFRRDSNDLIIFVGCPAPLTGICTGRPFGTYDNVARARAEGVEFTLTLKPVEPLTVQGNYTYTDATNRSPGDANFGRQLLRRPQHSANVLVDYRWAFGLTTGVTLTHVGSSFDNAANTRKVQGYILADLRAAIPLWRGVEAYGRIENLFDERYETVRLYGSPGRGGFIGLRVRY